MIKTNEVTAKVLTSDGIIELYPMLERDFPRAERRPLSNLKKLMKKGIYTGIAFYRHGELVSYALFIEVKEFVLLDYFAVNPDIRGGGIGSAAMQLMLKHYKGKLLMLEAEDPAFAKTTDEVGIRTRRLAFYKRNGGAVAKLTTRLGIVDYRILYFAEDDPGEKKLLEGIESIYREIFSKLQYLLLVRVRP